MNVDLSKPDPRKGDGDGRDGKGPEDGGLSNQLLNTMAMRFRVVGSLVDEEGKQGPEQGEASPSSKTMNEFKRIVKSHSNRRMSHDQDGDQ